jgi:hypothetical protein
VDESLFAEAPAGPQPGGAGSLALAGPAHASSWALVAAAWLLVAMPLSWGVFNTIALALQMVR